MSKLRPLVGWAWTSAAANGDADATKVRAVNGGGADDDSTETPTWLAVQQATDCRNQKGPAQHRNKLASNRLKWAGNHCQVRRSSRPPTRRWVSTETPTT